MLSLSCQPDIVYASLISPGQDVTADMHRSPTWQV